MAKLKQLLATRFGKGLELRALTEVNASGGSSGHVLKGHDLHIPIRVQEAFLGTAVIPSANDLSEDNFLQISQMVRMVLEPALYRDYLERREGNLRSLSTEELDVSNLKLFGEPESPEMIEVADRGELSRPRLLSNLLHLHGHDTNRIKKAALLLHEMTGRWAFAPLQDIAAGISDVTDLIKLGSMTLYAEDVTAIDGKMQAILAEYMESPQNDEEPLIITGSAVSPDDLQKSSLHPQLKDEVSVNGFELDRAPLTEKGLREVLALMFFRTQGDA